MINRGSVDPLKLVCSDYEEDSDKCPKLLNKIPKQQYDKNLPIKTEVFAAMELIKTIDA